MACHCRFRVPGFRVPGFEVPGSTFRFRFRFRVPGFEVPGSTFRFRFRVPHIRGELRRRDVPDRPEEIWIRT
jgi:hypothetical protein